MSGSQPEMPDAIAGRLLERPENARAWKRLGEMAVDDGVAVIQVLRARVSHGKSSRGYRRRGPCGAGRR